jgi:hypothetical protein
MINETEIAQTIIFVRSWMPLLFFSICHHPVIYCNGVFCLKRSHDSNIKGEEVMYSVWWKNDTEYFLLK